MSLAVITPGMKLPNSDKAVIAAEKVHDYLLSPTHPIGRHKAVLFGALGYTQSRWRQLESDLRVLLDQEATPTVETEHGSKFEIHGSIAGPNGRSATIVTAWIILHGDDVPRFITAYPED